MAELVWMIEWQAEIESGCGIEEKLADNGRYQARPVLRPPPAGFPRVVPTFFDLP
jgi:hypothetical protein